MASVVAVVSLPAILNGVRSIALLRFLEGTLHQIRSMSSQLNIRDIILITSCFVEKTSHEVLPVCLLLNPAKWSYQVLSTPTPAGDLRLDHLYSVRIVLTSSFQEPFGPAWVQYHEGFSK